MTFRALMPGVAGVVLSDASGRSVATDVSVGVDAHQLASEGRAAMTAGASALVKHRGLLYLVVLLPA